MTRRKRGNWLRNWLVLALALTLPAADWQWTVSQGFPRPPVPADNPMSVAKVELGRHLFYDKRMSRNGQQSCATCHRQELAFTDGLPKAKGTTGETHPRGSMSLVNAGYAPQLTWVPSAPSELEEQALIPMLGESPIELGLKGHEQEFLDVIRRDATYQRLYPAAFPGAEITLANVTKALAAFQRSIVSMRSPYDRYRWGGDMSAISPAAKRGELLFSSSERGGCFQCHGGWNFGAVRYEGIREDDRMGGVFFNTGATPEPGRFRAPSLRNIAVTVPYMHDGSMATLDDVLDHYAAGGRYNPPDKTPILRKFSLTPDEKRDLIEFLKTLTDEEMLRDPRWSDPWPAASR